MALIPCDECTHPISEHAFACPQCGYPRRRTAPMSRAIKILLGVLVFILVAMLAVGLIFAWLAPRASTPIDVYLQDLEPVPTPSR